MKTLSYTRLYRLLCSLLLLSLLGCSGEDVGEPGKDKEPVMLVFNTSPDLMTRTLLTGPANLQHVRQVQLYIFDGTTGDARCVASENINWQYVAGAENGLPTREQKYKVQYGGFQLKRQYRICRFVSSCSRSVGVFQSYSDPNKRCRSKRFTY